MDKKQLLSVLEEKMKDLAFRLKNMPEVANKGFTINSGGWMNENGFCVAYISCARTPQEETIDLTIDVLSEGDVLSLQTGIYFSDGSLVQEFSSMNLPGKNLDEIRSGLERYINQISANEFVVFLKFLLQQKDEPN